MAQEHGLTFSEWVRYRALDDGLRIVEIVEKRLHEHHVRILLDKRTAVAQNRDELEFRRNRLQRDHARSSRGDERLRLEREMAAVDEDLADLALEDAKYARDQAAAEARIRDLLATLHTPPGAR